MATISKRYRDKFGRRIIVFSAESSFIFDTIANVCDLKDTYDADEYHIIINGKHLIFGRKTSYEDLMLMYQNQDYKPIPLQTYTLSKQERIVLEYDVIPFDKSDWLPQERLHALHELLDLALLLQQIDWAKNLHASIRLIEMTLHRQ